MAEKVKFKTGPLSSMPSDLEAGTVALARDTGDMYICVPDLDNPTSNTKYKHHINPQTNYNQTDTTKLDYLVGRDTIAGGIATATTKAEEAISKAETAQASVRNKLDANNSLGTGYIAYNKSSEVPPGTNSVTFGTSCAAAGNSSAAIGYNCKTSAVNLL